MDAAIIENCWRICLPFTLESKVDKIYVMYIMLYLYIIYMPSSVANYNIFTLVIEKWHFRLSAN
jgi:hypothetical protein